jgi:hypothetical protein
MLPTKFRFIWPNGYRREESLTNMATTGNSCLWLYAFWKKLFFCGKGDNSNLNINIMDRDEISNFYRGPSIDVSYQVSAYLAEGFQRRGLKCEKLTDDRRRTTDDGWRATDDGLLISSRSVNKHGRRRPFLFLIGRFLKIFYSETAWPNGPKRGRKPRFIEDLP